MKEQQHRGERPLQNIGPEMKPATSPWPHHRLQLLSLPDPRLHQNSSSTFSLLYFKFRLWMFRPTRLCLASSNMFGPFAVGRQLGGRCKPSAKGLTWRNPKFQRANCHLDVACRDGGTSTKPSYLVLPLLPQGPRHLPEVHNLKARDLESSCAWTPLRRPWAQVKTRKENVRAADTSPKPIETLRGLRTRNPT